MTRGDVVVVVGVVAVTALFGWAAWLVATQEITCRDVQGVVTCR